MSAESVLNILLNVETADEIKTYALRVASGDMVPKEKPRSRQSMFVAPSLAPTPASTDHHDDGASMRSGTGKLAAGMCFEQRLTQQQLRQAMLQNLPKSSLSRA